MLGFGTAASNLVWPLPHIDRKIQLILLIDNYDSFVHNLYRYLVRLGQAVQVVRNDADLLKEAIDQSSGQWSRNVTAFVLSPGPKKPEDAGYSVELVKRFSGIVPILGVCLGHQAIYAAFGGKVVRALRPIHGQSCDIVLSQSRLFENLPPESGLAKNTHRFARYHSLVADPESLPNRLKITAWSTEKEVMAIEHFDHPTFGIQFHPESILSQAGYQLLANFLQIAKAPASQTLPANDLLDVEQLEKANSCDAQLPTNDQHAVALPRLCIPPT